MLGSGTRRIPVNTACLRGSRHSRATGRGPGWGMPAKASQEERMLLHRLDAEVVNLPHMADACDELGKLAERDSSLGTTVPDHSCEGAAVWGVRAERNLSQHRQGGSGRLVKVVAVGRHACIRGVWCKRSSLGTRDRGNSRSLVRWGMRLGRALVRLGAWAMLASSLQLPISVRERSGDFHTL